MSQRRRPLERTRQYDIWAEHSSAPLGPYRLVLQLVDDIKADDGAMMLRAGYRKDDVMRPSQPVFPPERWLEVLTQAIADPECFTDDQVDQLASACAARRGT